MRPPLLHLLTRIRNAAAISVVALLAAPAALAQGTGGPDLGLGYATAIGLATTDLRTTIARIISYFLGFLGIVAVCIMLYAGFLWMTAGGNEEKVSIAKRWMINGTIGLIIIMSAFAITQFIFRAVQEGAGGGAGEGCPPGQVCSGGGGFGGGGAGGFRVSGTTPAGAGPGNGGWPKNYSITVSFNSSVDPTSATPSSFEVRKCNARVDGSSNPVPFNLAGCGAPVAGTLTVDNNRVRFKPSATPGPEPTDFEGEFWYKVRVQGGAIRDTISRTLLCPFQTVDISSQSAGSDYCERAVAFNNLRDVEPPTVSIDSPASPPAYCASLTVRKAQVLATGHDDFLVAGIDFLLDGGSANLVDVNGDPSSNATNATLVNPFTSDGVYVDLGPLTPGTHHMTAVAQDGVPQSSIQAQRDFQVNAPHCCNQVLDAGDGETDVDCGVSSGCGACNGSSCTDNAQCASGFCDPATHTCEERPFIQTVSTGTATPRQGGVGTLITITGTGFGSTPGSVVFLGIDPDPDPSDDATAVACAPQAWTDTEVTVAIPTGAVTGPLKLTTSSGPSDRTDDTFGPLIGNFTVAGATSPGVCYLDPSTGAPASKFAIHGAGFGAAQNASTAFMGANTMSVTTCGSGETDCGWSDNLVWANVPPIAENVYPVKLVIGGANTNTRNFLLRNSASSNAPRVTAVIPESGPVGTYVTVQGSGFGSLKGTVKLKNGLDTAIAADPVCDDNWHDNYIIIKVPPQYQDTSDIANAGIAHKVQVVTAPPSRESNDDITFRVTTGDPRPGICSITPDNGPPGNLVEVRGEGFGTGPGTTDFTLPPAGPRYSVLFFKTQAKHCLFAPGTVCTNVGESCGGSNGICVVNNVPSTDYSTWSGVQINTLIAGETVKHCSIHTGMQCADAGLPCPDATDGTCVADKSGWPATGPVYVVGAQAPLFVSQLSSNAIPFTMQNCAESGAACPSGESCCANGSCQKSCQPVARNSAYTWKFSTNVLPVMPQVVERAVCDLTAHPSLMQSPSPQKGATDACINSQLYFEFNRVLDRASFSSNTVKLDECGDQAQPNCATPVSVPIKPVENTDFTCDSLEPTHCSTFQTRPANAYNGNSHYFKKNVWYRVTLVSRPGAPGTGLQEPDGGRFLDGDRDRSEGGDYVYTFRIRDNEAPCEISNVMVIASAKTIQQDQDPVNFNAALLRNCALLQCVGEPYALDWSKSGPYLQINPPAELLGGCTQPVRGVQETGPIPTPLTLDVTPLPFGTGPSKQGESEVTVKFADPRVIDVTPKAECVQACINAAIVATFNVPMDPDTLDDNANVELLRCRNSSCLAPFEETLTVSGAVTADAQAVPPEDTPAPDGTILHKHVTIQLNGDMDPGTFYLARIKGGAAGVKSRSGVNLAGLNDGGYYTWKFRTKDDPTACAAARTSVNPNRAVMRYVGERKGFTVTPFGSPDECSPAGQQLRATSYTWIWNFDEPTPNRVVKGFYNGGTALPIYSNASPTDVVDTMPFPKLGCTANCLLSGSQREKPQCGNGVKEAPYEECDDGNSNNDDACTNQCRLRGNTAAGGCGDHAVSTAAGESCDMIAANVCAGGDNDGKTCASDADCPNGGTCGPGFVFPAGCKKPDTHVEGFGDNIGCVFTGSSAVPGSVCGDGFIGDGEACDDGNQSNGDGCSADCLVEGSLRSCLDVVRGHACINYCGNHRTEPGEDPVCENTCVGGARGGQGCNPDVGGDCPGGGACTGPGVAPGCNATTCLKTGTPKCAVPGAGSNCCGNNVDDLSAGEDSGCDTDPERAEFCNDHCQYKGSSPFYTSPSFCGDGIPGKGEKAACEPSDFAETAPPLVKIDPFQAISAAPQKACQGGATPGATCSVDGDCSGGTCTGGFDPSSASGSTTTVKATVDGVPDAAAGRSQVTLACNCKNEPVGHQDEYCQNINSPATDGFACADNGCCTPRPGVASVMPTDLNSCRNAEIDVLFDTLMNGSTVATNLLVGYNNGDVDCPEGSVRVPPLAFEGGEPPFWQRVWNGVLAFVRTYILRPVFGVAGDPPDEKYCSVQGTVTTVAVGAPGRQVSKTVFAVRRALPANKFIRVRLNPGVKSIDGVPIDAAGITRYFGTGPTICSIDRVQVSPPSILLSSIGDQQAVIAQGLAVSGQAIVPTIDYNWDWSWTLPTEQWEIVLNPREANLTQCALGAACAAGGGCPCTISGTTCNVLSGQSTCDVTTTAITSIADVRVRGSRGSDLPTGVKPHNTSSPRPLEAIAHLPGQCTLAPDPEPPNLNLGVNALGVCTAAFGCDCAVGPAHCTVVNGQTTCAISSGVQDVSSFGTTGTGRATVLLCDNPWPRYQRCDLGTHHLTIPWLPPAEATKTCDADTWFPFYDTATNTEFYYCRDIGQTAGDASFTTLPCLKEKPAQVLNPGPDILREYLFTFEIKPSYCPVKSGFQLPPAVGWTDDAIGLRVSSNLTHLSSLDWYQSKGFQGSPKQVTVDGYDAVQDERTVYVNAAAKGIPAGNIYTNVNTLSHSDGAEPETVSIFNQILSYINFNSGPVNSDLLDMGLCRHVDNQSIREGRTVKCNKDDDCRVDSNGLPVAGRGAYTCEASSGRCKNGSEFADFAGISIGCSADVDCEMDAQGKPIAGRDSRFVCDAPKDKLTRDVRRWSDLQYLRWTLIQKNIATEKYPELKAGTFLRAQTNSRWPSWSQTLGAPLGATLPVDPLNKYGACAEANFDSATCWNDKDRIYKCPASSHVYEYRSIGGTEFQIYDDFEYKNVNGGSDTWKGGTCAELTGSDCNPETTLCAKTCNDQSLNRGASCITDKDCPSACVGGSNNGNACAKDRVDACPNGGTCGDARCDGPCNYKSGKIFIGGGSNPFPGPYCVGAAVGVGGTCGDGILSASEACEIGQTTARSCDADPDGTKERSGNYPQVCNSVCQWQNTGTCSTNAANPGMPCVVDSDCHGGADVRCVNWATTGKQNFKCVGEKDNPDCQSNAACGKGACVSACVGGYCGDGIRQNPPEACDDGPLNGTYGHCNATCSGGASSCGDGKKQPNEACDCRDKNGQYAFNGVLSTGAEPGINGLPCQIDSGSGKPLSAPSCAWDCQSAGPRCGDGVTNGSEKCDGGFQEFKGYCNDTAQTGCDTTAQCPELGTCSESHCTNDKAKACGTNDDCVKVCGNFCPTPEQKQRRECTPNNPADKPDDSIACTWAKWLCTAPGSCGNGHKDTGEECDDGNTDNSDSCIIDPGNSYRCKSAQCGDGYVYPGSGEECDDGVNNGRPCIPRYGLTCNYCSGACRVSTVSGGFCGDGLVEDFSWTPPPPPDKAEQCDGGTGLGVDWICVGKAQQYKSYGKYLGQVVCSDSSCRRACLNPDAEPCLNAVGVNSDNDACPTPTPNGCHGPFAYNVTDLVPGEHRTCVTGFDGKQRCTQLATSTIFNPNLLSDPNFMFGFMGGGGFSAGSYTGVGGFGQRLYDACDPDDDNDGVPDDRDCNPKSAAIHPSYYYAWTDHDGKSQSISIPKAVELCNDIDEDCDNVKQTHLKAHGRVIDIQTGKKLDGGTIEIDCDATKIYEIPVKDMPDSGDWSVDKWIDNSPCTGATEWKIKLVYNNGSLCPPTNEYTYPYSVNSCMIATKDEAVNFEVTKKPPPGVVRATVEWTQNFDLDLHLFASDGEHIDWTHESNIDSSYKLDIDDRGTTSDIDDPLNPGGIETITVNRKAKTVYSFWVNQYREDWRFPPPPPRSNWLEVGLFTGPDGVSLMQGPRLRLYFDDCSMYEPVYKGNDLFNFLHSNQPWFAFLKVGGPSDKSAYCISNTDSGDHCSAPCAGYGLDNQNTTCETPK